MKKKLISIGAAMTLFISAFVPVVLSLIHI